MKAMLAALILGLFMSTAVRADEPAATAPTAEGDTMTAAPEAKPAKKHKKKKKAKKAEKAAEAPAVDATAPTGDAPPVTQ